jgi:hypothetical protein
MCGAGVLLSIGAANKIVPIGFGFVGLAFSVAFLVIFFARVLKPPLTRLGIWRGRNGS